jgi:hypothetical protein
VRAPPGELKKRKLKLVCVTRECGPCSVDRAVLARHEGCGASGVWTMCLLSPLSLVDLTRTGENRRRFSDGRLRSTVGRGDSRDFFPESPTVCHGCDSRIVAHRCLVPPPTPVRVETDPRVSRYDSERDRFSGGHCECPCGVPRRAELSVVLAYCQRSSCTRR